MNMPLRMPARRVNTAAPVGNAVTINDIQDGQYGSIFDWQPYAAAGQDVMTFFQQPTGAIIGAAGGGTRAKTLEDTNMISAGQLPAGWSMVVQEVQFRFQPAATVPVAAFGAAVAHQFINDMAAVGSRGHVKFTVLRKEIIDEGPLNRFPPDTRLDGFAALSDTTTAAADRASRIGYAQWAGKPFRLNDVRLEQLQAFAVTVSWPNGRVALPSAAEGRLGCFLRGFIRRVAQ